MVIDWLDFFANGLAWFHEANDRSLVVVFVFFRFDRRIASGFFLFLLKSKGVIQKSANGILFPNHFIVEENVF